MLLLRHDRRRLLDVAVVVLLQRADRPGRRQLGRRHCHIVIVVSVAADVVVVLVGGVLVLHHGVADVGRHDGADLGDVAADAAAEGAEAAGAAVADDAAIC